MVHLSVAIGRFFETLFWAILRAGGIIGGWVALGVILIVLTLFVVRALWRWERRGRARRRKED